VGNLIVRDVDDDLIARLHERAAAHGRSAEAEHGADLRSLAEPELDTKGDFAELVLTMLGVTAKLERRRISNARRGVAPTRRRKASNSDASRNLPHTSSARRGNRSRRPRRNAASPAATTAIRRRFRG
jgi:plasmid stability protein